MEKLFTIYDEVNFGFKKLKTGFSEILIDETQKKLDEYFDQLLNEDLLNLKHYSLIKFSDILNQGSLNSFIKKSHNELMDFMQKLYHQYSSNSMIKKGFHSQAYVTT